MQTNSVWNVDRVFFKEREKIQNIHLYQLCELQQTDNIFCAVELTALFISSSLNLEWLI